MHYLYDLQEQLNGGDVSPEPILKVNVLHFDGDFFATVCLSTEYLGEKDHLVL